MEIKEASEIVLSLAKESVIEDDMCETDTELWEEQSKQEEAIRTVEDFHVAVYAFFYAMGKDPVDLTK